MSVAVPTNQEEHIKNVKARLGEPVIRVNVADSQFDIAVEESKHKFLEFHETSTENVFVAHQLTQTDIQNGYVITPEDVVSVVRLLPLRGHASEGGSGVAFHFGGTGRTFTNPMFTAQNQFDTAVSPMVSYYLYRQNAAMIDDMVNGEEPINWNAASRKLIIHEDVESKTAVGNFIVYEAHVEVDNEAFWAVQWFLKYTAALVKRQWATNLGKFQEVELPGGYRYNAQGLMDQALAEIEKLEEEVMNEHAWHPALLIG